MTRYRKLPVVIEAVQWAPHEGLAALVDFFALSGPCVYDSRYERIIRGSDPDAVVRPDKGLIAMLGPSGRSTADCLLIETLEGPMMANPGDWIIRGVAGEFYACKPEIFVQTYEPAGPECNCPHQTGVVFRSGSGHHNACPVHAAWVEAKAVAGA